MRSPVMVHQHVHEVFEEARLAGAEEASCYLVHCLLQLGDTVIVGHSVVAEDGEKHRDASCAPQDRADGGWKLLLWFPWW